VGWIALLWWLTTRRTEPDVAISDWGERIDLAMTALTVALPIGLFWIAAAVARTSAALRAEADGLRAELDELRAAAHQDARPPPLPPPFVASARPKHGRSPDIAPEPRGDGGTRAVETAKGGAQVAMSRGALVRALDFPRSERDREGFELLRRALDEPGPARLIGAAQDVLSLLGQEGVYMDDLAVSHASPSAWRAFAAGHASPEEKSDLAGLRDRSALALAKLRLAEDGVFREAAALFLETFLAWSGPFARDASDAEIAALAEGRTGRAFMLLGAASGLLGPGAGPG
jgi:hypothetical protein